MRVLISGAGGFIGRHLALAMAHHRHEVVALVRRSPSALHQQAGVRIACTDLAKADALPREPFDALIHCAAAIPSAVPDEAELTRVNVGGSRRLFAHALDAGARVIIFCSSMSVYGRVAVDVVEPDTPINEPNAYGRSKLAAEHMLAEFSRITTGLRALSIRLPGVVGPGSHDNFLSETMRCLAAGESVVARNSDALFNNVVHVADLAGFVAAALGRLPLGHRVTTIAASDPLPIREVVAILERAAGRNGAVRFEPGERSFLISSEDARSLGYRPATTRDSVERFARHHQA